MTSAIRPSRYKDQPAITLESEIIAAQFEVPHLAILPAEGGWQDLYSIFLEPATASFDRLDVAHVRSECSTVKAAATYEWHLDVHLA